MSQTGVTGKEPHHYGLYLPCFPPVYCHGWWDIESSHSLRDVLLSKLTPVRELQSSCALQLLSIWNGNPQGACSPFRNPGEAGSALQLSIWSLLSPWLLLEPSGLPGSLPERVSSRGRREGNGSQLPQGMHSLKCTGPLNICNKMFKL